jgi:hypothetical protein
VLHYRLGSSTYQIALRAQFMKPNFEVQYNL